MSEPDDYPVGVPCWVEGWHRDPDAARAFYGALMGWDFEDAGGVDGGSIARVRGREVAGLRSMPVAAGAMRSTWTTHVAVDSVAATAQLAAEAGGTVVGVPTTSLPGGSSAVIADPAGAVLCVWERDARRGAQVINEGGAWAMSALQTPDPHRSADFYARLFGWRAEPMGPPEANVLLFRLPGYVGGTETQPVPRDVVGVAMPLDPAQPPHWHLDFWVDDADGTAGRTPGLGGKVAVPPHDAPPFRSAELVDLEGAAISISQLTGAP